MKIVTYAAVLAVLLSLPAAADARSVYLNGVNIDGVTGQEFKNCTIKVDADGNLWITAKDYVVKPTDGKEPLAQPPGGAPQPLTGIITKKYWLVTEISPAGRSGYDVDVYINNNWVKKVQNNDEQIVMDITKHMRAGGNVVKFAAIKAKGQAAVPGSKAFTNVIVGEGSSGGNNVVIDKPILEYKRFASEGQPFVNEHTVTAR